MPVTMRDGRIIGCSPSQARQYTPPLTRNRSQIVSSAAIQRGPLSQKESGPATGTLRWAYGTTTVPARRYDLLPRTLDSLKLAGFDKPRLFVDGCTNAQAVEYEQQFGLPVTPRGPSPVRTAGSWLLSLAELYLRDPNADRYLLTQDDCVTYPDLRAYLERSRYPGHGYLNLYLFPENADLAPKGHVGWYPSNQKGKGAVALIFSRDALMALLTHPYTLERPQDAERGWRNIDGGIVMAMRRAGFKEFVHFPSLTQHVGHRSTMGSGRHPQAPSFKGESYSALDLLKG